MKPSDETRKIVINIGPQEPASWMAIALAVFFISIAMCMRGCWDALAREKEANAALGKAATEIIRKP